MMKTVNVNMILRSAGGTVSLVAPVRDDRGVLAKALNILERRGVRLTASSVEIDAERSAHLGFIARAPADVPVFVLQADFEREFGVQFEAAPNEPEGHGGGLKLGATTYVVRPRRWGMLELEGAFPPGCVAYSMQLRETGPQPGPDPLLSVPIGASGARMTLREVFAGEITSGAIAPMPKHAESRVASLVWGSGANIEFLCAQTVRLPDATRVRLVELVVRFGGTPASAPLVGRKDAFAGRLRVLANVMGWTAPIIDDLDTPGSVG